MIEYIKHVWAALCGRPVLEVQKKVVEIRDLSMTTADMKDAKVAFQLERWKKGAALEDFARSDGEQRVIAWFERRIGARVGKVGSTHVL